MAEAAKKLNRSGGSHSGYIDTPYEFRKMRIMRGGKERKLNPSQILVLSVVHSFSTADRATDFTYAEICRRYRLPVVSVGRAVRDLMTAKLITRDEHRAHDYRKAETKDGTAFLRSQEWLYHVTFDGRYLTRNEIAVLSYLMSWTKNGKDFTSTNAYIARGLNLSKTTVGKCLNALQAYELIFIYGRSRNGFTRAIYRVNGKLLRAKEKELVKRKKGKNELTKALDAQTERERWYAAHRSDALKRADQMKDRARADAAFRDADDTVRRLRPQVVQAEFRRAQEAANLRRELMTAERVRAERLRALNLTEADFLPRWHCPICEDTGYRKEDGRPCTCYDDHRREPR